MDISIPQLSLVVLVGPSGAGKSTFAQKHFLPTEVISSDFCRGIISDNENDQSVTKAAFELLGHIVSKRLESGRLTVVDATNVQPEARAQWVELARKYHFLPVAIVLNLSEKICHARNQKRPERSFGPHVVRNQRSQLKRNLKRIRREGYRYVFELNSLEQIEAAILKRVPLWNDRREEQGPFDIIGDIHGCCDELEALLAQLGYVRQSTAESTPLWGEEHYAHPEGRKVVFLGDLVDRGPRSLDTVRIVRNMVQQGTALCVPGNHDMKLLRKLKGKDVKLTHGLAETVAEIEALPTETREPFCQALAEFLDSLISHYVLDQGKLVVAHAGMTAELQGRGSGKVRSFALYGETTGETDEFGFPVRYNWAAEYRGAAHVVYGHTPVPDPEWLNRTVNIDTGCVFGGRLTALRYPEKQFVTVPAKEVYCEYAKPMYRDTDAAAQTAQQQHDDLLDLQDVTGKRIVSTRLQPNITIREENATAALEVMSRFAANPKWLIYLPPTMSPPETSSKPGLLEHPAEAFAYFRNQGIPQVICEEKHMGSRAVVVVCRDQETARLRFGVQEAERGIVYTRTGRRFFNQPELETACLERVRQALSAADFWNEFQTDWACFDCELMPWSAKAQALLQSQYAAVGAAGKAALPPVVAALEQTTARLTTDEASHAEEVVTHFRNRQTAIEEFIHAYRHYCWPVETLNDLKLAPFHLLATEGRVHIDQNHHWHMQTIARICEQDEKLLLATPSIKVDLTDNASVQAGIAWWSGLTNQGGEGMVVKPLEWIQRGTQGLVQPAIKCRGKEYLRIIYGPDYDAEDNLSRLRNRNLHRKRSLAQREFALGIEALERFVNREPLRRVHECVFGVLALESEPVDPRL